MVHPPAGARWGAAAGSRNQPGLVVHNRDVTRKLLYGKRELVSGAKTRHDVSVTSALLAARFSDLRKVVETAVQSSNFDRRDLSHFIANSRSSLRFSRAVAIVEHYNRVGKVSIKGQHYGQLMGLANTEGLWRESMAVFAALTHRSEFGPVAMQALEKRRSNREGRELLMAASPHVPHAHAYGHLMYACRLGGRWRAACVAFNQLVADKVPPTDGLVQDAVRSLSMSPDWRHALVAFSTFTAPSAAGSDAETSSAEAAYSPGMSAYKQLLWHVTHADVPNSWEATLKVVGEVAAAAVDVHAGGAGVRLAELQALEEAEQAMEQEQSLAAKNETRAVAAEMARADGAEPFAGEDYSDDYVAPSTAGSCRNAANEDGELALDDTEDDGIVGALRPPSVVGSFDGAEDPTVLIDEAITDAITLPSTVGPNGIDAGLLGTALRACAAAGKWEIGVGIFNATTVNGARSHVACNGNTMQHLSELRPRDAQFQVQVMNHTFETGFTVGAPMYTQVFTSLAGAGRSDEALALFYKLYDSVVNDVTNIQVSLGELYNGMVGALLAHPAPAEAAVMARELQGTLEATVIECTGCLGSWGDDAQLWTAEGRVAVVDGSILLDRTALAALTQTFDNVVIPYSELRRVIADAENQPGNVSSDHAECVHYLKRLVVTTSGGVAGRSPYRVLPFVHELRALSLLQSMQSAYDRHSQAEKEARRTSNKLPPPQEQQVAADSGLLELMSAEARVGGRHASHGDGEAGAIPTIIPAKHLRASGPSDGVATWSPSAADDATDVVSSAKKALARAANAVEPVRSPDSAEQHKGKPRAPHFVVRSMLSVTGQRAGCIATAAMLKRHNPDAQVSIITEDRNAHKQFGMVGTALRPLLAASAQVGAAKQRNSPRTEREAQPATSGFDSHLGSRVRSDVHKSRKKDERRLQGAASTATAQLLEGSSSNALVAAEDRVTARRSDFETQRDAVSWLEAAMRRSHDAADDVADEAAAPPLREPAFWFPA